MPGRCGADCDRCEIRSVVTLINTVAKFVRLRKCRSSSSISVLLMTNRTILHKRNTKRQRQYDFAEFIDSLVIRTFIASLNNNLTRNDPSPTSTEEKDSREAWHLDRRGTFKKRIRQVRGHSRGVVEDSTVADSFHKNAKYGPVRNSATNGHWLTTYMTSDCYVCS